MKSSINNPNLLESAKQGDSTAIAVLLNKSLNAKEITAEVRRKDDCLRILLEAAQVPDQDSLVGILRNRLTRLGLKTIKTVKVYGKQQGEELPTWLQEFSIGSPQGNIQAIRNSSAQTQISQAALSNSSNKDRGNNRTFVSKHRASAASAIRKNKIIDDLINLDFSDKGNLLSIAGSFTLFIGVFCPIASIPWFGHGNSLDNFQGWILIALSLGSVLITAQKRFRWLWLTGSLTLMIILWGFLSLQLSILEADSRGWVIRAEWGWFLLFLGSSLIIAAALIKASDFPKIAKDYLIKKLKP